ncbi:hypothetical protein LTR28_009166, partial [Elasticomyces elasticus]
MKRNPIPVSSILSTPATASTAPPPVMSADSYPENGRRYHAWRRDQYMYPCDEDEKERLDVLHKLFKVARQGTLHSTRISKGPDQARILDLGCGTGFWAMDMGDEYPNAEIIGVDLVNIQPPSIPPATRFRIPFDYESPWALGRDSWDLIHLQLGCGSVASWPDLLYKIFTHLKPGVGCFELVEIDYKPRCDDGTLAPDSPLVQWYNYLEDATGRASRPIAYPQNMRQMLTGAGFTDIEHKTIALPYNEWPVDPHQKELGRWQRLAFDECKGIEALSMAAFTRIYN